jgi:hypothetical protein
VIHHRFRSAAEPLSVLITHWTKPLRGDRQQGFDAKWIGDKGRLKGLLRL